MKEKEVLTSRLYVLCVKHSQTFYENTSACIQLVHKHFQKSVEMFLVSNSIFIISRNLVYIIGYQTNFQKYYRQKDSSLLLQKRVREKR